MNQENDDYKALHKNMEETLLDVKLRAEFEFEEVWLEVQRDPILSAMIHPELFKHAKKIMKHGFITGAQAGVVHLLEKIANEICE